MFLYKNFFSDIFYSFNPNHAYWNQRRLFSGNLPGMFNIAEILRSEKFRYFDCYQCSTVQLALHILTKKKQEFNFVEVRNFCLNCTLKVCKLVQRKLAKAGNRPLASKMLLLENNFSKINFLKTLTEEIRNVIADYLLSNEVCSNFY